MATSSYNFDVNPLYRDAGCPSQCMSQNEYTTVGEYYSYGTDPKTALLRAMETPAPVAPAVPSTFSEDYRVGVKPPTMYEMDRKPIMLGHIATRFEECAQRDSYGNCLKTRQ